MGFAVRRWLLPWISVFTVVLLCCRGRAEGPIRYSVLEESEAGTEVGNVARDLGVDVRDLVGRKFRLNYKTKVQYFTVSMKSGALLTKEILDREALCGSIAVCVMNLEVVMDNPLEFHRLEVEIVDINDNAPNFPSTESNFAISESTVPGTHFPLKRASDPDVGPNSQCSYSLSPSHFFTLGTKLGKLKSASVELVLTNSVDREQQTVLELTLTAEDDGNPKKSGTQIIIVYVQDVNDNAPVFEKDVYSLNVLENIPLGNLLIKVNATDLDVGSNGEVVYSLCNPEFPDHERLFSIDADNGEIRIRGHLDFEDSHLYEINVQAQDNGSPSMARHCKVLLEIIDANDNAPEVEVTSFSSPVKEDAQPGLVIALFTVTDKDSGVNGEVRCQIPSVLPFTLESKYKNFYSLSVKEPLDREVASEYNVTVVATDGGSPSLSTLKTITVSVSDVNDNPPSFTELSYVTSVPENNVPGSHVLQVSALDPDTGDNARVRYSLIENSVDAASILGLFSIHPETGAISALQSFDYEKLQVVQFRVKAKDYGSPSLSGMSNVTVFIQDANDNPPTIFHTVSGTGNSANTLQVPQAANTGYVVTKIRAIDSDSGHNAWLNYEFKELTTGTPFRIGRYTGEISLRHPLGESYMERYELIVLVKDNGTPPLSATLTLTVSLLEKNPEVNSNYKHIKQDKNYPNNLNSYLIISIAFILGIFIVCIILFTVLHYLKVQNKKEMAEKLDFCHDEAGKFSYSQSQQYNLYLTAQPTESGHETLRSNLSNQGWTHLIVSGGMTRDLMQRYSITEGNASQTPNEVRRYGWM